MGKPKIDYLWFWRFILLLLVQSVAAQPKGITDGPYVFYRGDQVVVKSVIKKNGNYIADSSSFPITKKFNHVLRIHIDDHPEWDFNVKIRKTIINEPATSPGSDKVFAVSDIEGEFEPFRKLLLRVKVIDSNYNWIFGKGNLLVAGDLFDRGKQVTQYLWLLYKLEDEAKEKGGAVHVILGNHEIMNLSGDLRYVDVAYYVNCKTINENYTNLYTENTELGRWLRSKNVIEKDGDFLMVHGGVAQVINKLNMPLAEINSLCRPYYALPLEQIPDGKIQLFFDGTTSPFWYRGYFITPKATQAQIDSTLAIYQVRQILVGHDIIDHISRLYNNEVIGLDVDEHQGTHEGLLSESGVFCRIDDNGLRTILEN